MKRTYVWTLILGCLVALPLYAQELQLSPQQKQYMMRVGKERVLSFQEDLNKHVMNPAKPLPDRIERIHTHTKLLFINEDCTIGVTDMSGRQFNRALMEYLRRATRLSYTRVEMTFSNLRYGTQFVYDPTTSEKKGGEWYTATVVYEQEFKGWKGAEATFSDKVERVMTVYVEKKSVIINDKKYVTFHALLGDSKVTEFKIK